MRLCLLVLVCCGWLKLTCQELSPVLRAAAGVAESEKTGCYVVVLKKGSNYSTFQSVQERLLDLSSDSRLYGSVHKVVKAVTVALNDSMLDKVSSIVLYSWCYECLFCRSDLLQMLNT